LRGDQVAPDLVDRLKRHVSNTDVFIEYRIDEQILKALDRKVWLPSGGYLVIDRTEAMTVIDVNTGKFTGSGGNLEETVTRNNLEAAEEIVRQLRLRDIGGGDGQDVGGAVAGVGDSGGHCCSLRTWAGVQPRTPPITQVV